MFGSEHLGLDDELDKIGGDLIVPKLVEAENGRRSWNRQIRILYINDKKAVEISPQPFLYLALIFIAVNLSARYFIC